MGQVLVPDGPGSPASAGGRCGKLSADSGSQLGRERREKWSRRRRRSSEEEEEEGWECEEDLEEPQQLLSTSGDERRLRGPGLVSGLLVFNYLVANGSKR